MVISYRSAPPRAKISSTARAPAMPLPMTTNFSLLAMLLNLQQTHIDDDRPVEPFRRTDTQLELALGIDVLDDRQRDVHRFFGAHGEQAHGLAAPIQRQV